MEATLEALTEIPTPPFLQPIYVAEIRFDSPDVEGLILDAIKYSTMLNIGIKKQEEETGDGKIIHITKGILSKLNAEIYIRYKAVTPLAELRLKASATTVGLILDEISRKAEVDEKYKQALRELLPRYNENMFYGLNGENLGWI